MTLQLQQTKVSHDIIYVTYITTTKIQIVMILVILFMTNNNNSDITIVVSKGTLRYKYCDLHNNNNQNINNSDNIINNINDNNINNHSNEFEFDLAIEPKHFGLVEPKSNA